MNTNGGLQKVSPFKDGYFGYPFRRVKAQDFRWVDMIQVADLTTGSITAYTKQLSRRH